MTVLVELPEKVFDENYTPENRWSRAKNFAKKSWSMKSSITVEPFVVCYVLPSIIAGLAAQTLCFEKACVVNLKYNETVCQSLKQSKTALYEEQEKNVHEVLSTMTAWSHPPQTVIPGILALFIGAWSDRTGNRKLFMLLPTFGKFLSVLGVFFCAVFFLDVGVFETALIDALPPALSGGRVAVTIAVFSYITDITTETDRTFRLAIITVLITLSRPIGLAIAGIMITSVSYLWVFAIAGILYLIGFVYIMLRLRTKSSKTVEVRNQENSASISVKDLFATVNVALKKREYSRRLQIILTIIAYMLVVGPIQGEAQISYWFMRYKFKYTEVDYSLFLAYSAVVGSIGSFITTYLFSKRWKMDDCLICGLACLSRIAASVGFALAPKSAIYVAPALDMFSSAAGSSLRSIASKTVLMDESGKISSLISISEALVPVVCTPLYSNVYKANLKTFPGLFYIISAMLAVIAVVLLLALHLLRKKENSEKAKHEFTLDLDKTDRMSHT